MTTARLGATGATDARKAWVYVSGEHPSNDDLAQYLRGLAPTAPTGWIESHLEKCPACCQALSKLATDDRLIARLRAIDIDIDPDHASGDADRRAALDIVRRPEKPEQEGEQQSDQE